MTTGRVKWFSLHQGYGYITLWDGREIYFQTAAVLDTRLLNFLEPGSRVSCEIIETRMGYEATNVRRDQ